MNIIIIGCGKVGAVLAMTLTKEEHDVSVVDTDMDALKYTAGRADVIGVEGNGASLAVQNEAGIDKADVMIATTGSDEVNLLCCLIAKKANRNVKTIARVRNPIYLDEISFFKEELGLTRVINPERAAAREIARTLRFRS
ncbi:MAG: NAD-binding protein, partial [Lachnospiraceae bacterium]|nr:NAD-binding protein [Lachnospiraceae bacterium]